MWPRLKSYPTRIFGPIEDVESTTLVVEKFTKYIFLDILIIQLKFEFQQGTNRIGPLFQL